jgi:hypothetical protein
MNFSARRSEVSMARMQDWEAIQARLSTAYGAQQPKN